MGTNFYWRLGDTRPELTLPTGETVYEPMDADDPVIHIGKRSAAGLYCWDCGVTLCMGRVHYGDPFHERCPRCGKEPIREGLNAGPVAVELGFSPPRPERPTGVRGCSSFTWAQDPARVLAVCVERPDDALIEDEYGRDLTCREFAEMVTANCPIQFTEWIGRWFS